MTEKRALGRGLSALIQPDVNFISAPSGSENRGTNPVSSLRMDQLTAGRFQPRSFFDEDEIISLASSIKEKGVLQPIVVRRHPEKTGFYEIIAGERRWRASKIAGLESIPVVVANLGDAEALEVALLENIQRQDLSPLEEAEGYKRLMDEFAYTQESLSKILGKSRSHVANALRLIHLPDEIKAMVQDGRLSAGHGRALLTAKDPIDLAHLIVQEDLSVRQAEELAKIDPSDRRGSSSSQGSGASGPRFVDPEIQALEEKLGGWLQLPVSLKMKGGDRGQIVVGFKTMAELDGLLTRLHHWTQNS